MNIIFKAIRAIYYCMATVMAKLRYGKALTVKGLLRKAPSTRISTARGGEIQLKRHVSFLNNVHIFAVDKGELSIGNHVFFNYNCIVGCRGKITIEDNVLCGPGVTIYDHDHCFSYQGILQDYKLGEITIGKGTWLGANVTILRNTHIGEKCVIGAGTVVKGDIPPHSLVTGKRDLQVVPIENSSSGL